MTLVTLPEPRTPVPDESEADKPGDENCIDDTNTAGIIVADGQANCPMSEHSWTPDH